MSDSLASYLPQDRLRALACGEDLPDRAQGAALFADISGFTPLTEQLTQQLGPRRGIEELTRRINAVYDTLIGEIERYGGSVIGFAGDAMTCWFAEPTKDEGRKMNDGPSSLILRLSAARAVAAASALQSAMRSFPALGIKVAVTSGPVRRFVVGDPAIQRLDTLAGATLTRLAAAEHLARTGEVVVDAATLVALGDAAGVAEWRGEGEERFTVLSALSQPVTPEPLPPVRALSAEELRPWVLGAVYAREQSGLGAFLTELRPATALFMSFGGLDYDGDEAAGAKLDAVIRRVQGIVGRNEGVLLQLTIGDKGSYLYANYGAVVSHEDDARRALLAALELQRLPQEFDFLQGLQIGVTSGTLRVGVYGGATRGTFGVLGDDVNLAARLMTTAGPGEILVSGRVHNAVGDAFTFEPAPPLAMKGKAEPLPVFAMIGQSRQRATRLREPVYRLPMVGRKDELRLVEQKVALARQGHGQVIGITAEAGMGKSRLVAAAIRLAQGQGFACYGGACESSGTNTAYLVWKPIWQAFFDIDPAAPLRRQLRNLEGELEDRAPDRLEAMPVLATLLDLPIEDNDFTRTLEPKERHNVLTAVLEDCLKSAAREEPLLFVLEDVHWIDALSYELVDTLARVSLNLSVCFILAYRPPDAARMQAAAIAALPQFSQITLHDLTPADAAQLIRAKLAQLFPERGGGLPAALVEQLTAKAQGNPFFLEELLNYLHDRDISPYDQEALASLELPNSLHTLVLSRIDQLSESQKVTLKVASIIGRLFPFAWLQGYYPTLGAPDAVKADLSELGRLDLTPLDTPEPELAYLFKHIVTQEVAYESLAYATRAGLHEQLAQYLETHGGRGEASPTDRAEPAGSASDEPASVIQDAARTASPLLDLLAFHYSRSENAAKQREYLRKAGEAAQAVYANAAALDYYDRLLPLLTEPAEQMNIHLRRGDVLLIGRWDEAETAYRRALSLAEQAGDAAAIARCQHALGELSALRGDYDTGLAWLGQARESWQALGAAEELGRTLARTGSALCRKGAYAASEQALSDGLALARTAQDRAYALLQLGLVAEGQGDATRARAATEEALSQFRLAGHKWGAASAVNNLGYQALVQGDYAAALTFFDESQVRCREIGDKQGIAAALENMGMVAFGQGDYAGSRALYAESLALSRETGDKVFIVYDIIGLAGVEAETADDVRRAAQLAGAAEALRAAFGLTVEPFEHDVYERAMAAAQAALGEEESNAAFSAGQRMTMEESVAYALGEDA